MASADDAVPQESYAPRTPDSQKVINQEYEVSFVSLSERSFAEGAMRSSAAQIIDLQKAVEGLKAQSAVAKTQGGALIAASCGLVPFAGIRARFALQPRRTRQSRSSRAKRSHRRRRSSLSALRSCRPRRSCAAKRLRARTSLRLRSLDWSWRRRRSR